MTIRCLTDRQQSSRVRGSDCSLNPLSCSLLWAQLSRQTPPTLELQICWTKVSESENLYCQYALCMLPYTQRNSFRKSWLENDDTIYSNINNPVLVEGKVQMFCQFPAVTSPIQLPYWIMASSPHTNINKHVRR